jgi:hypothetical protein
MALLSAQAMTLVSASAQEPSIQPGEWMVKTRTMMNGAPTPPTARARCFTAEQASNLGKTFGPQLGTINSTCADPIMETSTRTMKWKLECKGQLDMNLQGSFEFDSPTHYTATVTSQGWMGGNQISDVKTEIEGERVGDCRQ